MLVRRLEMLPIECVARGYLIGSGWRDYIDTGRGVRPPPADGLRQADRLPQPIFTPATKATEGHDMNITRAEAADMVGAATCWRRPSGSRWPSTRAGAERCAARRDHPGRHQVRARAPTPSGAAGAGRRGGHAGLLAPVARRPVGARRAPRRRSTSSTCATGSTRSAGTTPRPRRSCRRDVVAGTQARYREAPRTHHGGAAGDAGGGDRDAEGRRPRPPGPGRGRRAGAARVRRRGRGADRQAHRAGDRRRRPARARPARCARSCSRTP